MSKITCQLKYPVLQYALLIHNFQASVVTNDIEKKKKEKRFNYQCHVGEEKNYKITFVTRVFVMTWILGLLSIAGLRKAVVALWRIPFLIVDCSSTTPSEATALMSMTLNPISLPARTR